MRYPILFICYLVIGTATTGFSQVLPIKPARTISFTTDEATNMNVDISPDGKTLAFDILGDIYTVPVTGGQATQLTRGIALNLRPVWSLDGRKVACISDYSGTFHLNILDMTTRVRTVLGQSDEQCDINSPPIVFWTPDGNHISAGGDVYGIGGSKTSLPANIQNAMLSSKNGDSIYYLEYARTVKEYELYRYDQVQHSTTMISPVPSGVKNMVLSPDARSMAFIIDSDSRKSLVVQNLLNHARRILIPDLFNHESLDLFNSYLKAHYAFSPDSRSIYMGYMGKIHRIDVGTGEDSVIPFIANVKADLGPLDYNTYPVSLDALKVKYTRSANTSPDGKHLVFSALDRIYMMDLPDGRPRILALQNIGQFQPVFSPDGKWVAYVSWCDTVGGYLWRVPANGGKPEKLTQVPWQYQRPVWSPDGKFIAVIKGGPIVGRDSLERPLYATGPKLGDRDDFGIGQLQLVPTNGAPMRVIADSIPLWNQLAFSGDGKRIMYGLSFNYEDTSSTQPELVSKDLAGKNLRVIAVGAGNTFYRQLMVSPDGRYLVCSAGEDLYLLPVNKVTSPTVISNKQQPYGGIRFAPGVDPYWEKGGKQLCWTYGNHFYSIGPEKIIAAATATAQKEAASGLPEKGFIATIVNPDRVVDLNLTVPRSYAHGTMALTNVRIITMQGNRVIGHGTVVIRDGRIAAVGSSANIKLPKGAKVIDLQGKTIIPGFVDLHDHMRLPPDIFPQQSWMYLVNLAYGVTTARDPSSNFDSFGDAELLESGQMTGPRLYTVGRSVLLGNVTRFDGPGDALAVVQKRALFGGSEIKQYTLPTRIQREWLLMACREARLNMTNEGGTQGLIQLLGMIKDGSSGIEHNAEWGDVYKDVIAFFAKSGTYFTPTLQVTPESAEAKEYFNYKYWHHPDAKLSRFTYSDPSGRRTGNGAESLEVITKWKSKESTDTGFIYAAKVDGRIRKAGGLVTMGSHGNDEGVGAQNELWALQMGGLTNMEALQAATIMGAQALGIQKDVGSIEAGKIADLIILNKNPLDDIHNSREIKYVIKAGVLYDGDTLDEIWPVYKKCPEWRLNKGILTNEYEGAPKKLTGGIPVDPNE